MHGSEKRERQPQSAEGIKLPRTSQTSPPARSPVAVCLTDLPARLTAPPVALTAPPLTHSTLDKSSHLAPVQISIRQQCGSGFARPQYYFSKNSLETSLKMLLKYQTLGLKMPERPGRIKRQTPDRQQPINTAQSTRHTTPINTTPRQRHDNNGTPPQQQNQTPTKTRQPPEPDDLTAPQLYGQRI